MALQNLCIDIIVNNFERYFLQFSNTKDAGLKRRFEFLQRKFSYEIVSSLYEEGRMKTEYIDFFINKHLKVLEFDWLKGSSWENIVAKFKEVGPDLQNVDFSDGYYDKPLQDLMSYLPNLEVMTFHRYCTNEILKGLAEFCANILEIDISASLSVTNEGIKQLCFKENGEQSCVKLRKLLIDRSSITEEGMIYIMKHIPSIEITDLNSLPEVLYSMHKNDLPLINNIKPYNLQNLNLLHCSVKPYFTDLLKVCLSVCPHLKSLSCHVQNQEHLKILSELSALEKLHLINISSSEIEINEMLELNGKKLDSLSVSFVTLSVFGLSNSCPVLKHLHLNKVNFKIDSVSSPVFPCLEACILDCIIYNTESYNSVSHLLKSSPKLEDIAVKQCSNLLNKMKVELLKCCEQKPINKINFSGSHVEINFIRDILCNCHSLTSITLDDCGLTSEEELEIDEFSLSLPNKPECLLNDDDHSFLGADDEYLHIFYDFEDEYDDYDDYSGYDDYEDDDDPDYGDDTDDYDGYFFV